MFGIDAPLGLSSTAIPTEEWSKVSSTAELLKLMGISTNEEFDFYEDDDEEPSDDVEIFQDEF